MRNIDLSSYLLVPCASLTDLLPNNKQATAPTVHNAVSATHQLYRGLYADGVCAAHHIADPGQYQRGGPGAGG